MKSMKLLMLLSLIVFGLAAPAPPAGLAGGWALTLLDPLPGRFEAGTSYTIGYWLLQHGVHPYEGDDLGTTGIRLEGTDGELLSFRGVPQREPGHFAVAIAVPKNGKWQVHALQGWFGEQHLGTMSVPGGLQQAKYEGPLPEAHTEHGEDAHWGAIRPPDVDVVLGGTARAATVDSQHSHASAVRPVPESSGLPWVQLLFVLLGAVAVASVVVLAVRRRTSGARRR